MIKDKIVSISDLRTNATKIIADLAKTGDKYIFVHNKPKAVLVDIDWFEQVSKNFNKHGIEYSNPSKKDVISIKNYNSKKKNKKLEFDDAFNFLDSVS